MTDKCDLHLIKGCDKDAKVYVKVKNYGNTETRKFCLKHGIIHIRLMLLNRRKRTFTVEQVIQMFKLLKSPRAVACRLCHNTIKKGTMRLDANLGSGYNPYHYHIKCFGEKYAKALIQILTIIGKEHLLAERVTFT